MENILIRGITDEEREELHEMQLKREREETRYEDVEKIIASGAFDAAKACEILGVELDAYNEHLKEIKTT